MLTSVNWLNEYLDPPASADEQAELLTRAGFPLEEREEIDGDVVQDYEMTSNRGDCVCHVGLAREIAAISGRRLTPPRVQIAAAESTSSQAAGDHVRVINERTDRCPLYTARVIRGVHVGPSPDWLADRIRARGDVPRNNIVDATNYVLFELGQPTHVFDLATLAGATIIIRDARDGEPFLPLGEGAAPVELSPDDLVIADAERAVALAGVKGGAATAVSESTRDIVIEAATFAPVAVRTTSRRHNIASDSSYRFERGVHSAQVNPAADRLASLILELAGGELCTGVVSGGAEQADRKQVTMRIERCRSLLGVRIETSRMLDALERLGFAPAEQGDVIACTVPHHRLDIDREVDLIEEVARMIGLDSIPIADSIDVRVAPPQPYEQARKAVSDVLTGEGFLETITHSLISEKTARLFLPQGMGLVSLEDDNRLEPVLQPSILPGLLQVLARSFANGMRDVRLYETASIFGRLGDSWIERSNLAILMPAEDPALVMREMRGILNRLVTLLAGPDDRADVQAETALAWFDPCAVVRLNGEVLGCYGPVADTVRAQLDVDVCVVGGEFGLPALYDSYPPDTEASALPSFPSIERDISLVLDEHVQWSLVEQIIEQAQLEHLESTEFVTVYRGKQIGAARKSLTLRLRFRSPDGTLRHSDVDPQMSRAMTTLRERTGADIRQ